MRKNIAVIGAGISGLTLAQNLKEYADIVVYEKVRGVGGRMSTRHADPFYFDHGTQCFTARTKAFQNFLAPYSGTDDISEWHGKVISLERGKKETKRIWFEPHLVASPNMNSLCKKMAEGLDVKLSIEIVPLVQRTDDLWVLHDANGNHLGNFDWVISTAPPAQTLNLFQAILPEESPLHKAQMQGCFSLMIGFHRPWDRQWIAAKVRNNPIKWISINSTKPHRNNTVTAIVAHSRNDWAEKYMERDIQEVQKILVEQFESVTEISCAQAGHISIHRWKYAVVEATEHAGFYFNPEHHVAATSDWASTSRIEEVWQNAMMLSQAIIRSISR